VTVAIDTVVGPAARTAVWATGTERLTYLDAVLSQRLRDAPVGTATSARTASRRACSTSPSSTSGC
jgi:hypothetical protein